ncbi:MAG TPA: hypothetical protein PLR20_09020 [Syntrophales bacterium]|nr:hypothetical protein [Syntrophales bacterium]HOX94364.1 hypothetical protein [Syntrophales bacterium]HPI57452.1 hypothetical protein [Syntrophales bacterium]HPN25691.1 hypothetical protein [Syntrophales bacterium]HQM29477.1 hypothetical protein [Syntrophales bacterium]
MKSKRILVAVLCVAVAIALMSCASNKEPAAAAIKAAEDAFNAVKVEAMKYVPDKAKAVEDAITAAKGAFEKKDYDTALNGAKAIPDKVKELSAAVTAKKAELTKAWDELSAGLPKMLDAVKSRLDILSKSKKLPAGLDKPKFEGAKSGYEAAVKMWEDAKAAFTGGNMTDALAKATTVKEKAVEVMTALGMQPPAAATATKG